jgi:molybdopterin molybdotransferase
VSTASVSGVLPWAQARLVARTAANPLEVVPARLPEATGAVLAEPLAALTDLPPFDTAAMDGWAVAGRGPWVLQPGDGLAGAERTALAPGTAAAIATGAPLPDGASGVLRREAGVVEPSMHGDRLLAVDPLTGIPGDGAHLRAGADTRGRGEECRAGDPLVGAGVVVTPAMVGLAAAAGYDALPVVRPPVAGVLVLGDELLERGLPRGGKVRDALGPLLPSWLAGMGARANPPIHVPDSREDLLAEIEDASVDVLVTTGSTARGPVDHLHEVLRHLGARWLVDGVSVRPGHPMLLARLADGRFLIGLPGNPLAAVSGLLTLAAPLITGLRGDPDAAERQTLRAVLREDIPAHPHDTRLWPVSLSAGDVEDLADPLRYAGPAMLRGLALADGVAVVPPGAGERGTGVEVLRLPTPV